MQTWDAICARRNIRLYTDEPIPHDRLTRIVEAGRRAPSAFNGQPWDFVIVTDRPVLKELSRVWQGAWHAADSAATIALIAPVLDDPQQQEFVQYDLGQATANMMLAATDLGIGSAHAAVTDQTLARGLLGFPADRFCAYLVVLGHSAEGGLRPIRRPARRPLEEVAHWETWTSV